MPLRCLFWNLGRRPLGPLVAAIAAEHQVNLVILTECEVHPTAMLRSLNTFGTEGFRFAPAPSGRIHIFSRFSTIAIRERFGSEHVSLRNLTLPDRPEIILCAVHLRSKLWSSEQSQHIECIELAERIAAEEDRAGHRRTVVVGDFNMNPFELGMVASNALNSVMSRQVASLNTRRVQGREFRFFYNPMWTRFGDEHRPTAGTYFYNSNQHVNYYWNIFDQVLIRPELAERFPCDKLSILTSIQGQPLTTHDGRPNRRTLSDHLPILFELEF